MSKDAEYVKVLGEFLPLARMYFSQGGYASLEREVLETLKQLQSKLSAPELLR